MMFLFDRTTRFASFPDYLVIQIKKFTFGLDWVPKKLGMLMLSAKYLFCWGSFSVFLSEFGNLLIAIISNASPVWHSAAVLCHI